MKKKKQSKSKRIFQRGRDILSYLERSDKWYLGGDNALLWAPPFPVWLDYPGFWDKAHFYNREIEPVFTWTILDDEENEILLHAKHRTWDPSKLVTHFELRDMQKSSAQIKVQEIKYCIPDGILGSTVQVTNLSKKTMRLHFFAWTIQPNYPSKKATWIDEVKVKDESIHFTKYLSSQHPSASVMPVRCRLSMNRKLDSYSINLSEGSVIQPHWKFTPFTEKIKEGKLPNETHVNGVTNDGLVFMAIHSRIELPPQKKKELVVSFSVSNTEVEGKRDFFRVKKQSYSVSHNQDLWKSYFSTVPNFQCSDEYLSKYYWYRWYGLRLNTINVCKGNYQNPFVCEGIGYFRAPISYSAMCHIAENRWLHTPALAQGSMLTFISNQHKDGRYRGYIDVDFYRQEKFGDAIVEPFYHANWGKSVLELHRIHPDVQFLKKAYTSLIRYVEYFDRERDEEGSGLYDIDNHYETGQEYMHRYMSVDSEADKDNWGEVFRLKGVDVTVYQYELKKALAEIAEILGDAKRMRVWQRGAEVIKQAVRKNMWDEREEMFFDVDPQSGLQTKVKAATCFYPYMTDIVDETHLPGLKKHLFSEYEFWTRYPVVSSSVDDTYFNADAEWKGKRMNCPWNGRVWPMTNSHIAEALAQTAIRFNDQELKQKAVEFIMKFIRMMFYDSDSSRPNCFEHYNPETGQASIYRGVDDYQHSWVADLILKYVCGIRPTNKGLMIDPFPFDIESFSVDNIKVKGKNIKVERMGDEFRVTIAGKRAISGKIGQEKIFKDF